MRPKKARPKRRKAREPIWPGQPASKPPRLARSRVVPSFGPGAEPIKLRGMQHMRNDLSVAALACAAGILSAGFAAHAQSPRGGDDWPSFGHGSNQRFAP